MPMPMPMPIFHDPHLTAHAHAPLNPQVTLYDATRYVIKPATLERRCSYVELVASGPQRPTWFVSQCVSRGLERRLPCVVVWGGS